MIQRAGILIINIELFQLYSTLLCFLRLFLALLSLSQPVDDASDICHGSVSLPSASEFEVTAVCSHFGVVML